MTAGNRTRPRRRAVNLTTFAWLLCVAGCSAAATVPASEIGTDWQMDAGLSAVAEVAEVAEPECVDATTRECVCTNGIEAAGFNVCVDGRWGAACAGCFAPAPRSLCVPGLYEGIGMMEYVPGPAGLCGVATLFGGSGSGGFTFRLMEDDIPEFALVRDGCFVGDTADTAASGDPTAATGTFSDGVETRTEFDGTVDCATGELSGEVRGSYVSVSVCGAGVVEDTFFYKGWISGQYNPDTESFEGLMLVREPEVPVPVAGQPGGQGDWRATRTDTPTIVLGEGEACLRTPFEDFEVALPPPGTLP